MIKDKRSYNILVIEDNPGDFALVEDYLEEQIADPVILQATNFKQALALLSDGENDFNAILLDLTLPDRSGVSLITDIVSIASCCPVIILTGFADIDFSINSIAKGISDYLLKDDLNATTLYKSIVYAIERKKNILKLKESEKRYSDLFYYSPQPMCVYDLDTLRFLSVNNAAVQNYGYTEEEFLSMTVKEVRYEEDIAMLEHAIEQIKQHNKVLNLGIFRHVKKNGEIIYADVHSNPVVFDGKKAVLIIVNDVTDSVQYIKEIEEQNKKLQDIAWMQSHVVRAPLARMMGIVNAVKALKCATPECEKLLGYFSDSGTELDNIIRSIVKKTEKINLNSN
jgi:PAS domain S-box-containing protein